MSPLDRMYARIDANLATLDPVLEAMVHADAAHVTHLVLEGRSQEADAYATRDDVAARIRTWKETR